LSIFIQLPLSIGIRFFEVHVFIVLFQTVIFTWYLFFPCFTNLGMFIDCNVQHWSVVAQPKFGLGSNSVHWSFLESVTITYYQVVKSVWLVFCSGRAKLWESPSIIL